MTIYKINQVFSHEELIEEVLPPLYSPINSFKGIECIKRASTIVTPFFFQAAYFRNHFNKNPNVVLLPFFKFCNKTTSMGVPYCYFLSDPRRTKETLSVLLKGNEETVFIFPFLYNPASLKERRKFPENVCIEGINTTFDLCVFPKRVFWEEVKKTNRTYEVYFVNNTKGEIIYEIVYLN